MSSIISFFEPVITSIQDAEVYALHGDSPMFGGALEISKGFASFFTADEYLQNIISAILSPVFIILLLAVFAYIIYYFMRKYDQIYRAGIAHGSQLLLFKARQKGLSNYQYKILKGISDFLHLERPSLIADDPRLFERSISKFMQYLQRMGEAGESMDMICRDIVITYEKIYHSADIRKPIMSLIDCEINVLAVISINGGQHYIAKIRKITADRIYYYLFAPVKEIEKIIPGTDYKGMIWRAGDARYDYSSVFVSISGNSAESLFPNALARGQLVVHPLIGMVIPCRISASASQGTAGEIHEADIFKLNESEVLVRLSSKLDHNKKYSIAFTLSGFMINTDVQILGERYIADRKIYYYNLKYTGISEAAKTVIGNELVKYLFP